MKKYKLEFPRGEEWFRNYDDDGDPTVVNALCLAQTLDQQAHLAVHFPETGDDKRIVAMCEVMADESGPIYLDLKTATQRSISGEPNEEDDLKVVFSAFAFRTTVECWNRRNPNNQPVLAACRRLDDAFNRAHFGRAVLDIKERWYYDMISEYDNPERGTWWAARLDLDETVPEWALIEALQQKEESTNDQV